jgi:hypothetical protein
VRTQPEGISSGADGDARRHAKQPIRQQFALANRTGLPRQNEERRLKRIGSGVVLAQGLTRA